MISFINQASSRCQTLDTWEREKHTQAREKVSLTRSSASTWFEQKLPSCIVTIQKQADLTGNSLDTRFIAPLRELNHRWSELTVEGPLPLKIAVALLKAPISAVRNVLVLFYSIIKSVLYACIHPVDAFFRAGLFLIDLVHALVQPENCSKMGAGMIGASLGVVLITGNPFAAIGAGLGVTLVILGLCMGPLKAALLVEEGARKQAAYENFTQQVSQLQEMFFTGFLMGLCLSPIAFAPAPAGAMAGSGAGGMSTVFNDVSPIQNNDETSFEE